MTNSGTNKSLVLALCCLAQFMVVLDIAIVNVALPSIQTDLDMRQSALQWVVIAYGLLLGGFLLLGGRLGDLIGRRRILLAGLALFSAASLLAGLAVGLLHQCPHRPWLGKHQASATITQWPSCRCRQGMC